ncbi:triose-phosphate isomerase [Pelagibacterium montanilacus]|uniref:triose-phosphate isomerase n=1 Tax=Pelagibacterium montanilacus TaxID=2185280 RepID=UPI000F8E790D|nr:triose-phosphate isomerase [Pelagibacterium montanilacus]
MDNGVRPLIAGNWKMNGTSVSLQQIGRLQMLLGEAGEVRADILVCPPATLIERAVRMAEATPVRFGGQDCHAEASGAYTGDTSATMLADAGASFVILGHSERRAGHGEESALVKAKAEAAMAAGLVPIVCVGETEAQRDQGIAPDVVERQVRESIPGEAGGQSLVIAYEPVWAIGTGKSARTEDIAEMHAHIRRVLEDMLGESGAGVRILYGGSVKPDNAGEVLRTPNVNGALVGGASLHADDFFSIILAC